MHYCKCSKTRFILFLLTLILYKNIIDENKVFCSTLKNMRHEIVLSSQSKASERYSWQMKKVEEISAGGKEISMPDFGTDNWLPAIVPGTVLTSLVSEGIYPDPYYGQNNMRIKRLIPDIADVGRDFYYYWFRTVFEIPEDFEDKKIWLQFDGINYIAHIWLNGCFVGDMKGMFLQQKFDVSDIIDKKGKNCLAVAVEPVEYPGTMQSRSKDNVVLNENRNGGDGAIGKNVTMLMTAGWDFTFHDGIRDRNTGIWRDVRLFTTGQVVLEDPFIKSNFPLPDLSRSEEEISVDVNNLSDQEQLVDLIATIDQANIQVIKKFVLCPGSVNTIRLNPKEYRQLIIKDPKLWWPVNKGPQNLYTLDLKIKVNGEISDSISVRFGIRDIRSDQNTPDSSRIFYINGKRLFIRGSNWIPEAMLRTTRERTYAELRYTRQAGINMLRLWGGGISESDDFFDLCDELGILVWHEFWLTGDTDFPADTAAYFDNVRSTVKRLRNHPCLAYYVASNERNIVPDIEPVLAELDGTRGYQVQSECCGIHDGSPYKYENPMQYYDDSASPRGSRIYGFCPEYGTACLPTLEALKEMMPEEDLWPMNKVTWDYHDGNGFHNMTTKYHAAIRQYGDPENIEEYVQKGQMVGAVANRALWECWNYNKLNYGDRFTSGVLFWYHNNPVPQVCSRMWDWTLEPTAALYFTQDALEPLHAQYDFIKNSVSLYNDLCREFRHLKIRFRLINMDMKTVMKKEVRVDIDEDAVANDVMKIDLRGKNLTPVHFIKLEVYDQNDNLLSDTFYWRSTDVYEGPWTIGGPIHGGFGSLKQLGSSDLDCSVRIENQNGRRYYTVRLSNPTCELAFFNRLKLVDKKTEKLIRPVFYSDNYFSLLPLESKIVTIDLSLYDLVGCDPELVLVGFNVKKKVL